MQPVSVILAHPYDHSLNAAIAATVIATLQQNGYSVHFHDLYREGFNPLISGQELVADDSSDPLLRQHQEEIARAHGIIIVHPNWWGQPPAILKGWVDRVLREHVAYTFPVGDNGGGLPIGLLPAKAALVFNTSNTPEQREHEVFGDPLERIWKDCIFAFCGVHTFDRLMFRVVADSDRQTREDWLQQAADMVGQYFPARS
ncbi:NAD(P)H-dependent oxidoreductase [uncultured Cardiobacterium sp.]|uniref:NAD(P)H-dependent oxidoreductase n=1 Tax=uncultured Cardiobacterium sp. TaxID=417619 RepID=UPI002624844C|nr:NAD(P)H-dependent oxidoreductase [uncultured Cardiobacterium sp.]